ncbi:MAG: transcriptional repressor [Synergistaceae bacterium]|jgi:Fur family ferric uptake transcriptional regulator|nr:transcriptional repressor [Synergistaceae bacterium]
MNETKIEWPVGVKKTRQRQSVLEVLENSPNPLNAEEILSLAKKNEGSIWLSTVYRILDLFVRKGIAARASALRGDCAVYEINRDQHRHYAICVGCRKVIQMDNCPMEEFTPRLDEGDFKITGHTVEIYGYCRDCDAERR